MRVLHMYSSTGDNRRYPFSKGFDPRRLIMGTPKQDYPALTASPHEC